jgi:cation transport ATPase
VEVALDGKAAGVIAIADSPRDTAKAAVAALRELGVRTVMLHRRQQGHSAAGRRRGRNR